MEKDLDQTSFETMGKGLAMPKDVGGLEQGEQKVMAHLVMAWDTYVQLGTAHSSADDERAFRDAIHQAQQILGQRVLRREYPDYWR